MLYYKMGGSITVNKLSIYLCISHLSLSVVLIFGSGLDHGSLAVLQSWETLVGLRG